MSNFITPPSPFGRKSSPFYVCECPKCGCRQAYELGDPDSVVCVGDGEPDAMKTVERIPAVCPKCGAKWKKTHLPDLRVY